MGYNESKQAVFNEDKAYLDSVYYKSKTGRDGREYSYFDTELYGFNQANLEYRFITDNKDIFAKISKCRRLPDFIGSFVTTIGLGLLAYSAAYGDSPNVEQVLLASGSVSAVAGIATVAAGRLSTMLLEAELINKSRRGFRDGAGSEGAEKNVVLSDLVRHYNMYSNELNRSNIDKEKMVENLIGKYYEMEDAMMSQEQSVTK